MKKLIKKILDTNPTLELFQAKELAARITNLVIEDITRYVPDSTLEQLIETTKTKMFK